MNLIDHEPSIYSMDLHLTMKRRWFDMIESGEKLIEYREIKPYWINRLPDLSDGDSERFFQPDLLKCLAGYHLNPKRDWTHVVMMNGYNKGSRMHIREFKGLRVTTPEPGWSDYPVDKLVFGIVLGEALI